jgi:hypothetical protein
MAHHQDDFRSQHRGTIFEAADDLGGDEVAGDAGDEDVSYSLIEDELDRDTGIGAGEDGGEGLLLFNCVITENLKVLCVAGDIAGDVAL